MSLMNKCCFLFLFFSICSFSAALDSVPNITAAFYYDKNADGIVDNIEIEFDKAVDLNTTTIVAKWDSSSNQTDSITSISKRISFLNGSNSKISVHLTNSFSPVEHCTGGKMSVSVSFLNFPDVTRKITAQDKSSPVLDSVYIIPGLTKNDVQLPDTLVAYLSEVILNVNVKNPLKFINSSSQNYKVDLLLLTNTPSQHLYFLVLDVEGTDKPETGDKVFMEPGIFTDSYSNTQMIISNLQKSLIVQNNSVNITKNLFKSFTMQHSQMTFNIAGQIVKLSTKNSNALILKKSNDDFKVNKKIHFNRN